MKPASLTPDVIADVYEAALLPEGLARLPQIVAALLGVESVGLWIVDNGRIADFALTKALHETQGAYLDYFYKLDPWNQSSFKRLDRVILTSETFPEGQLVKTEFYNDFARPAGLFRPMGATIRIAPGVLASFGAHQPGTRHHFEEEDKRPLQAALPHIRRALQLRHRHRLPGQESCWQLSALDALAFGLIICDKSGKVAYLNGAAETLARRKTGIMLRSGGKQVTTPDGEKAEKFAALIHAAACGSGGAIRLAGEDGTPLMVLATPLPTPLRHERGNGHALLSMRPMLDAPSFTSATLSALFRLSPAQASLAVDIYDGKSFEEIALARGVKISTLRTHFAEILRRTGTKGQRELTRLLGTLPPLR